MHPEIRRGTKMIPLTLVLSCLLTLIGYAAVRETRSADAAPAAQAGAKEAPETAPAPEGQPAPPGEPAPKGDAKPGAGDEGKAEPADEPLPRIIRTVCTDHICGGCDGKCHRNSGHVAIDKRGHCACTPTEGSALDRATRQSYARNQPE